MNISPEKTEYIVTTFKYGHGGTPSKSFNNITHAMDYFDTQKDEKWNSVELVKVVTQPLTRFICSEEAELIVDRGMEK